MIIREHVPLASLTTLKVGGPARFVVECVHENDVRAALAFAYEQNLPWSVLGEGSNVLAADEGYNGVVLRILMHTCTFEERAEHVIATVDAGVSWDELVRLVGEKGLWGMENLAGIPGTVGASPVQNIGAYGSEVKDTITEVRVFNAATNEIRVFLNEDCGFGYRESRFKHDKSLIILSVTFTLAVNGTPSLGYKDLAAYEAKEGTLTTPLAISEAVRYIRSQKFPNLREHGTAGSFFKNPTISKEQYAHLKEQFEGLPGFPNEHGVKIPIAYILDHVLKLRGYTEGNVSIYANHALVLVSRDGATADDVDQFGNSIAQRVFEVSGIVIEREVQAFPVTV